MKTLNESYNISCKPRCEPYKKITNNITLIDNFFENFELAKNFFIDRDKWNCIPYQRHAKPGYESILPAWIGRSLMEKYMLDNKIKDDLNSYTIMCNFFYDSDFPVRSLSNSTYFPHIDDVKENDNILQHICLINLNTIPVSTKFYAYNDKEYCEKEVADEWNQYSNILFNQVKEHYDGKIISKNEIKEFLENKKDLKVKLIREIKYNPNQAIVYPSNLFHSPNVTEEFSSDNPRIILRISFVQKVTKNKNFNYR